TPGGLQGIPPRWRSSRGSGLPRESVRQVTSRAQWPAVGQSRPVRARPRLAANPRQASFGI
ncbi:MAG: hypothetical protein ABSF03_30060, partial [Streptosporangiaceae bacterium]